MQSSDGFSHLIRVNILIMRNYIDALIMVLAYLRVVLVLHVLHVQQIKQQVMELSAVSVQVSTT